MCSCMFCVLRAGIFWKNCKCSLQTRQALSLVDAIRDRARKCKCKSKRILPISFCSKKRVKFLENSSIYESDEEELEVILEE